MLAHFFLQKLLLFGDRTITKSITIDGQSAIVRWNDHAGAGFLAVDHATRLKYSRGKFEMNDKIVGYSYEATAQLVINAAHDRNRSALLDSEAVTDAAWKTLVRLLAGQQEGQFVLAGCTQVTVDQYECELWINANSNWSLRVNRDGTTAYGWSVGAVTR
jgi:hypothetical protein